MIQTNVNLKSLNTFGINVFAKEFLEIESEDDIKFNHQIIKRAAKRLILGGGSNVLFLGDFHGLVIKNNLKGIRVIEETDKNVIVEAKAGENWHEFVLWCLGNNYGGLENLSLIPGNVGAAPMQNIGAYGVEIKDVFHQLNAFEIESGSFKVFNANDCNFGYRESVFKKELKNQTIITSVQFRLTKTNHQLNTSYGSIQDELNEMNIKNPTINDVSKAVIKIRESKLPNPKEIGNGGSFFKNPIIGRQEFLLIQKKHQKIPNYPTGKEQVKLAAGWLIEQCGWKGKRVENAGVHEKQALVLVNLGEATGQEIYKLSEQILQDVQAKFGVELEREVNVIHP